MSIPTLGRPARRRWWVPALVAAFVIVPIAEVWLLVAVGGRIGVGWTLAILVAEALLGGWLMRREGAKAWAALTEAFNSGRMPTGELAEAALVLVGGVMLMLPGFVTDAVGLLFLLPPTRPFARRLIGFVIARQAARSGVDLDAFRRRPESPTVIPGEVVPDKEPPAGDGQVIRGELDG